MSERPISLPGKAGPISIERNAEGVPHITATSLEDAHLGLGFCHARDRGLQVLLVRILGQGRACEQLQDTEQMLELDRYFRRWNLVAAAAQEAAALSGSARSAIEAYCQGINLYFNKNPLPWELCLLGYKFEPWSPADTGLTSKIAGLVVLAQSQGDMERFIVECVQNGIGREKLEELFPGQLHGLDEGLIRRVRLSERLIPEALQWASALPRMMASNNWVVSGSKTASGKPFLCNDPHLELNRLPPVWYEVVLRWSSSEGPRYAMGATFPGLLGVAVGRTPDLSWGVTYAFMDCIDSWIEDCRDGKYRRGDAWLPFMMRKEVIRRKKHPPMEVTFYENNHGVLDGDPLKEGYYLATRWSAREESGAAALNATCAVLVAKTVAEGQAALGQVSNSSWNWVLADRTGSIGYQMSGKMPIRPANISGIVPLPGWDPRNDWQGFQPAEALPRAIDPPPGFIVTANQDLNHLGKVRPINLCMASYRADRICAMLTRDDASSVFPFQAQAGPQRAEDTRALSGETARPLSLEDMRKIQLDLYSTQAERFLVIIRPLLIEFSSSHSEPVTLLDHWDLVYSSDSKAAFIFEQFYHALICEVFGECECSFGRPVLDRILHETCIFFDFYGNFDRILLAENSIWFGQRSRAQLYRAALAKALSIPPEAYGNGRKLRMRHLLFGGKLPLFFRFDRVIEMPGNRATVHQGQIYRGAGRELSFAPSLRFMTDLGTDEIRTTLAGGPSDRFLSKWYANGLPDWIEGRYKILAGPAREPT